MDFGNLLRRAWDLIWDHKWLIILGILVALGSGGTSGNAGSNFNYSLDQDDFENGEFQFNPEDFGGADVDPAQIEEALTTAAPMLATVGIIAIIGGIIVGLAFWVISMIAQGGLIGGVNTLEMGGTSSFREAWSLGWGKAGQMLGIGLVPGIPAAVVGGSVLFLGIAGYTTGGVDSFSNLARTPIVVTLVSVICISGLLAFALGILANFAYRAAIIEDKGVFEAYARGWQVLKANFGPALLLWLIQIGIGIGVAIVMFLPALCCILWPVLIVVNGGIQAYFSTLWTLAWNEWTGGQKIVEAPTV